METNVTKPVTTPVVVEPVVEQMTRYEVLESVLLGKEKLEVSVAISKFKELKTLRSSNPEKVWAMKLRDYTVEGEHDLLIENGEDGKKYVQMFE